MTTKSSVQVQLGLFGAGLAAVAILVSPVVVGKFVGHLAGAVIAFSCGGALLALSLMRPMAASTRLLCFVGVAYLAAVGGLELSGYSSGQKKIAEPATSTNAGESAQFPITASRPAWYT
jgi:hypothetical protein